MMQQNGNNKVRLNLELTMDEAEKLERTAMEMGINLQQCATRNVR
jgi:hypothetical protein